MKKIILKTVVAAMFVERLAFNLAVVSSIDSGDVDLNVVASTAMAQSESQCPTGCYDNGPGCYCYYWFPTYLFP